MRNLYLCFRCIALVALCGQAYAAPRYWVGASTYVNNFELVADLNQWVLADDNGTGSWLPSGHGTGILRMDNGAGGYSNRLVNVNGGLPNYFPLDNVNGVVRFQVVALSGGTQRFYLQVEEYNTGGLLLNQQTIIGPGSAVGNYQVNLSTVTWNAATTQVRFVLVADNQSGQQGTVELNYFQYASSSNAWGNAANWSDSPGGTGGVGVPGISDQVFFDGSSGFNTPCFLTGAVTVQGISLVGYTGTIDLRGFSLTSIGSNTFNTGNIANMGASGMLVFNSTGSTTFAGTSFYVAISGTSRSFLFNGSYFNNTVTLNKLDNSTTGDTGAGGNTFQSTVTLTNSSGYAWRFASAFPDIFNGPLTLNVGLNPGASFELAYAAAGNQFNDNITISYNSPGTVTFGGAGGTSALAAGKALAVSTCSSGDCGTLSLTGIDVAAPQTINLPGTVTGIFATQASVWHGDLSVTAQAILLNGATFHGVTTITKTGGSTDDSAGGNVFKGPTTITNTGPGTLRMAVVIGDIFEAPVVFARAGGALEPAYNGSNSFAADVTTNSASPITFGGGNGLVTFTGADAQALSRATSTAAPIIRRLVMDKSANMLTLNTPLTIGVSANFLAGIIAAASSNYVGFEANATVTNAKDASHVDGVVKKSGSADFVFPVGDEGIYRPITITAVSVNSVFAAQFFKTPQLLGSAKVGTLATLSSCEYWTLDRESGLGIPFVTLSWRSNDCSTSYVSAPADLRVAHWNGSLWDDYGTSGYIGDNAAGTITTSLAVLSFSPFVLASATPSNPLSTLKAITVTVDAGQSKTYGDAEPALTYSLSAPLDGGDVFTGQLARAAGEDAGTYTVTQGTLDAGSNYQLSFVGDDFTIVPKAITITANSGQSKVYGAAEPVLTYSLSATLVGTDALTGALARTGSEDAGTYPITQGTLDAGGNYQLSFAGDDFTILPKAVTIAADARTKVYGEADPALSYTLTPPLLPGDNLTGALTRDPGEAAGTYTIHQGTLDAGSNYAVTFQEAALVITRQQQSIVFNDLPEKAEGDQPFTITATASSGLPVTFTSSDENMATVVNNTVTISGVGTVIITAHQDGNERFDPATPVSRDLIVRGSGLFVPNLFSPDGNGANDTFIVHAAGVREIQLVIYNSLGQEVFRTTDIDTATRTGWNGRKGNQEQPAGTYAWSLQGRWSNGDPISFQGKNHGQVFLLR